VTAAAARLASLLGAAALMALLIVAAQRLGSPSVLEWEEGATVLSADRLRAGLPLYVEPSLDWAPFPYGPGQPAVAAALGVLGLDGLLAARLSSWLGALLLLAGCAGLASSLAGPASGRDRRAVALAAAGWVISGYVATGAWLDVARPDALALGLAANGLWGAARSSGRARLVILAVMGALAVHTKQTVLLPLACAALGLGGVPLAAGLGAAVLGGYGLGELVTGPWYRFHTLELLAGHGLTGEGIRSLATHDLPRLLPLLAAAGLGAVASRHRSEPGPTRANQRALLGWALGGIAASVMGRLHPGGVENVMLPAFAGLAPLAAWGVLVGAPSRCALLALGLALASVEGASRGLVPSESDRAAHERVLGRLEGIEGEILAPAHPELLRALGRPAQLHLMFLLDLSASDAGLESARGILAELERRLADGHYAAAVLPRFPGGADAPLHALVARFLPVATELLEPGELVPPSGAPHRPETLYTAP